MLRHISTSIEGLLSRKDELLELFFDGSASDIRRELEQRKAAGELLIGSEGCEGFDPFEHGCPGHEVKED